MVALANDLEVINSQNETLKMELEILKVKVEQNSAAEEDLKATNVAREQELQALKDNVQNKNKVIDSLEEQVKELEIVIVNLKNDINVSIRLKVKIKMYIFVGFGTALSETIHFLCLCVKMTY